MSYRQRIPTLGDHYCQVCSSSSLVDNENKKLSCFSCDHCRLSMCYDCFEKHTSQLIDEYSQIQKRFSQLTNLFNEKRQYLAQFEQRCLHNVNSTFEEAFQDLQKLRLESIDYVRQQFNDAEIILSEMFNNVLPLMSKAQQKWSRDGITSNVMLELEIQRKQISDIEHRLDIFSSPKMQIKMATYPRNNLDLHCQPLINSYASTKKFSTNYAGKRITVRCTRGKTKELQNAMIDVETEIEELHPLSFTNQHIQTDPIIDVDHDIDDDEDLQSEDKTDQIGNHINTENCLSKRFTQYSTILTQNEVDRIASDGEHLLYYSETSKSLCYISNVLSNRQANSTSVTQEISYRWPHSSIIDLIYSPGSSQFVCATKAGVYTCTIMNSTFDIRMQLTQNWSYVRLSADKNYIWLWMDTPRLNQLRTYSPKTFECIKIFNLKEYPRFSDNSTSFCIHSNILATLFQFKQAPNVVPSQKIFQLTLSDSTDLHELCTIRLGKCDIDHEVRVNQNGLFFITNGKNKLWIADQHGKKEYVKLPRIGRALTVHNTNQIIIANGTEQLQCIELSRNDDEFM